MSRVLLKFVTLLVTVAATASIEVAMALTADEPVGGITLVGVKPASPSVSDVLYIELSETPCDATISADGYPKISHQDSEIRVLIETEHVDFSDFCIFNDITWAMPIGRFPAGKYSLTVDRHYRRWFEDVVENVGAKSIEIAPANAVPTLGATSTGLTMVLLVVAGILSVKRREARCGVALLISLVTQTAEARQSIQLLLPDYESAEAVVSYFQTSPPSGSPPLSAFNQNFPEGASFLVPLRARGDEAARLQADPQSPRAKLERYLLVSYSDGIDLDSAAAALRSDINVKAAYISADSAYSFDSATGDDEDFVAADHEQYGRDALNITAAWQIAGGYALVGVADTGLHPLHEGLRQFAESGNYLGGPFASAQSLDIGYWPDAIGANVDEGALFAMPNNTYCNPNHLALVSTNYAGHGTHVAGLISANAKGTVKGTCKQCTLGMMKIARPACTAATGKISLLINWDEVPVAVTLLADSGAQVINLSLGAQRQDNYCDANLDDPLCLALTHAANRDVILVAASGNQRVKLQYPASDKRVVATGGIAEDLEIWDESPGNDLHCPYPNNGAECGSNFTTAAGQRKQETVAAAHAVLSLAYPGLDWNPKVHCGDSFGTNLGDGIGLCTGTSMAAPQIAGIVGVMRSTNPLVHAANPILMAGELPGIRSVLAQTTVQSDQGIAWSNTLGYGRPDAARAVSRILGTVDRSRVINRATPLFRFYSAAANDYADTVSPQMAVAFLINQAGAYQPKGLLVPGYAAFPNATPLPSPRANVYVLTTEYSPRPEWPPLIPLYMIDRSRPFPIGCAAGSPGCNSGNRDFTLVSTVSDIEQSHADGYNLRAIQGYIYQRCQPEPSCVPPGAQKLYRECNAGDDDCAVFLENERAGFEAKGFTAPYPAGSDKVLGYAYPAIDSDGDGLIDGFEYAVGTRVDSGDSDGDGIGDGVEMPMAGVAIGDPCDGPLAGGCPADVIFKNGFQ